MTSQRETDVFFLHEIIDKVIFFSPTCSSFSNVQRACGTSAGGIFPVGDEAAAPLGHRVSTAAQHMVGAQKVPVKTHLRPRRDAHAQRRRLVARRRLHELDDYRVAVTGSLLPRR